MLSLDGKRTVSSFHRELGLICWDYCGMARTDQSLKKALDLIPALREEFWETVSVPGGGDELNPELEKALRVADFLEFAELMCYDALGKGRILRRAFQGRISDRRGRGPSR